MRARRLLSEIDRLSYRDRMRHLAERAMRLPSGELDDLLDDLSGGDTFERIAAVVMAEVAGRTEVITRLLADPVPRVQARALAAVGRGADVSDDTLAALYDDAPAALRSQLLRTLRAGRRTALAVRLVDQHREHWGDQAAARLLPVCDDDTVRRLLPELGYCLSAGDWQRLGARRPDTILAYAEQSLAGLDDAAGRTDWWQSIGWGVAGAVESDPEAALALIERALPPSTLPASVVIVLGRLIDADPPAVLRILTEPGRAYAVRAAAFTPALRRRLERYTDEDLAALGRVAWASPSPMAALLGSLPPSRRQAVFAAVTAQLDLGQMMLGDALLDVLPHAERHDQARRMLGIAAVRDSTHRTWETVARLPFDEAFALLDPEVRRPEADDRAVVYRAVVDAAARSRDSAVVGRALEWAVQVHNDRDPVRQAVLGAVADIPPGLLTAEHVPVLNTLLTDALEARDASWQSSHALRRLAATAVKQGAIRDIPALLEWGLHAHERLAGRNGHIGLHGIVDGLPHGRETAVYDALRPHVESGAKRNEFALAFDIATSFGRRGHGLEHLHEILERAVWSNQEYTVQAAVRLWLEPPATRSDRIERIVSRDVGMVRWDGAWYAVTAVRTDLLDRVFARPAKTRRFDRDHPHWHVPPGALQRWLPRQQARYADLLAEAARDRRLPIATRADAVRTLGRVPGVDRSMLTGYAADPEVLICEAALAALAWTDRPDLVLPDLIVHAGDDRARVATYALTRAARFVRPSALTVALRPMLFGETSRVTSRKEAARLLGELRAPGAVATLAEAWPAAHRDVRAAIASAVSQHLLYDDAAWPLLEEAATGPAATAVVIAARRPAGTAERHRPAYGRLVLQTCEHPDRHVSNYGYSGLASWGRWVPEAAATCAAAVTDLDSSSVLWPIAVRSLVELIPLTTGTELVDTVRTLVALDEDPEHDADAERDRPARRRFGYLVTTMADAMRSEPANRRPATRAVADALATHPSFVRDRLELLTAAVDWTDLDANLDEMLAMVIGRPLLAATVAELLGTRLNTDQANWRTADLEPTVQRLTAADLGAGLMAVTLTKQAGTRLNWPPTWRQHVADLRRHPDPDVRLAALSVAIAAE